MEKARRIREAVGSFARHTGTRQDCSRAPRSISSRISSRRRQWSSDRALQRALDYAATLGVTTLQDVNPTRDDVALFADFRNRGRLTARLDSATLTQSGAASRVQQALGSDWPRGPLNPMTMLQVAAANGRIGIADALTAYTAGSAALTIEQTLAPEGTARRFS